MILSAAADHDVDLARSWMIGDGVIDVAAGRAAGIRSLLVSRLKLDIIERFLTVDGCEPDAVASDLQQALSIMRHIDTPEVGFDR